MMNRMFQSDGGTANVEETGYFQASVPEQVKRNGSPVPTRVGSDQRLCSNKGKE